MSKPKLVTLGISTTCKDTNDTKYHIHPNKKSKPRLVKILNIDTENKKSKPQLVHIGNDGWTTVRNKKAKRRYYQNSARIYQKHQQKTKLTNRFESLKNEESVARKPQPDSIKSVTVQKIDNTQKKIPTKRKITQVSTKHVNVNKQRNSSSNETIKAAFWNAQSIRNKHEVIKDYISEQNLDILFLAETFLKTDESETTINKLKPDGFEFGHKPRKLKTGGGLGWIYRKSVNLKCPKCPIFKSMEMTEVLISGKNTKIRFVIVYRAESSDGNRYTMSEFYDDCTDMMTYYQKYQDETIFCGDFNFHMNKPEKSDVKKLTEILDIFGKVQHVTESTHESGNTLDLIITDRNTKLLNHQVDLRLSDHNILLMDVNMKKPCGEKKTISFRRIQDIDKAAFKADLSEKVKSIDLEQDVSQLVHEYNSKL